MQCKIQYSIHNTILMLNAIHDTWYTTQHAACITQYNTQYNVNTQCNTLYNIQSMQYTTQRYHSMWYIMQCSIQCNMQYPINTQYNVNTQYHTQ